jgi:hypothetical protein
MLVTAALLTMTQAAEPAAPATSSLGTERRQCTAVEISAPPFKKPRDGVFSATRILDLQLDTVFGRAPSGPHTLYLKVFTPRGHLYQVLTVPFTSAAKPPGSGAAAPPQKRWVEGYPQPLEEKTLKTVTHEGVAAYQVSVTLPVAGTSIMTNSLYGQWKAEPYLDQQVTPCGDPRSFVINP